MSRGAGNQSCPSWTDDYGQTTDRWLRKNDCGQNTADAHGYAAEYMYAVVVRRTLAIHHEECLGRPCADSGYF